jgi:poly(hydroxyalkanoate) depolymerase family esterase
MTPVDWRALYASNQAAIARAGGTPTELPHALRRPAPPGGVLTPSRSDRVSGPRTAARRRDTRADRRLSYHVHRPRDVDAGAAVPLVCMLHGCTQDAAALAAATRMNEAADRHGFVVVYVEQSTGHNHQRCWNWFLREHQSRGAGEPAAIAAAVRDVVETTSRWTIDTGRVFVAGLSAGGAMAIVLAYTYPDIFSAVAVHSGLAYRSATHLGAAFAAMAQGADDSLALGPAAYAAMGTHARPIPSIVIHGSADQTVAPGNANQLIAQAIAANRLAAPDACGDLDPARPASIARRQLDGGHAYTSSRWTDSRGATMHELLEVEGLGHAWSGGAPHHAYSDPRGPSATEAIWRFFRETARQVPGLPPVGGRMPEAM